jgi:hypothetical protein
MREIVTGERWLLLTRCVDLTSNKTAGTKYAVRGQPETAESL